MNLEVKRITSGPKHHLFGFHDLVQTNAKGDLALSLEVDDISHPPLPGGTCWSGVVPANGGDFIPVHKTHTWNYPQGARQQWMGDSNLFTCNDRDEQGNVFAWIGDARERKTIDTLPFPVHCMNAAKHLAFWFDYDRVHACGGYGYHPNNKCSTIRLADMPSDDGVWVGDIKTGERHLLVSMQDVAACGEKHPVRTGYPHYVTHFMLNPTGNRLAFLHRYRVPDGGETTRLMTIGVDGSGLRCLAKGFLSHFTWIADNELFIWGEHQPGLCAMREARYLRIPGVLQGALLVKKLMRMLRRSRPAVSNKTSENQSKAFLRIEDAEWPAISKCAIGLLTEDGHPMSRPGNFSSMISDTYPHEDGNRILMLYDAEANVRTDIGQFKMIPDKPDEANFDVAAAQSGMDKRILRKFSRSLYLFARSGFHCDLHPRWSYDGKAAYFDSIHEGTRQVYAVSGL